MIRSESSITIGRPSADVYRFVSEGFFDNYPKWSPEVVELQQLSRGPLRVGTVGRQVRVEQGRRLESTFRVTELEAGRHIAFVSTGRPHFRVSYRFEEHEGQTRLTFSFDLKPDLLMRPFERLIRVVVSDGSQRVVRNLKGLLESGRRH